jgi:hypothetical protein
VRCCNNLIYNPLTLAKSENKRINLRVFFLFQACGRKSAADFNSDFHYSKSFIQPGGISSESDIRVVLAFDKKEWKVNEV